MNNCKKALEYIAKQDLNSLSWRTYRDCMTSLWIRWSECHGIIIIKEMFLHEEQREEIPNGHEGKGCFVSSLLSMSESPFSIEIPHYYDKFYKWLFIYLFMVFHFNYQGYQPLPFGLHILYIA